MRLHRYQDAVAFSADVLPLLLENEAQNCVTLGVLSRLMGAGTREGEPAPLLALLRADDGRVVGAGTRTEAHPLCLAPCPAFVADAFAERLAEAGESLSGVIGEVASAEAFANSWHRSKPYSRRLGSRLGVYQLQHLRPPVPVGGTFRPATAADLATLTSYAAGFYRDIGEPAPTGVMERTVSEGRLFVWCDSDGRIVSMAAWAGPTPNGARVNFVYTPPEFRGRGFASNCVAAVTRLLLESGRKFVFLFTDISNPTSNRIYRALGYEKLAEHQPTHFDPPAGR